MQYSFFVLKDSMILAVNKIRDLEDKKSIVLILLTTLLALLIMLPLKPVIAGDDFSYALSVNHLINTGEIFIYSTASPSLIFQIIWGSIFAKILGFSIPVLHFSVFLFLPFLGLIFYFLCRELKIGSLYSLILTFFLISIPWYFRYSFGFRTDLPYTALQMASIYFYFRGVKRANLGQIFIGSIFAALAFLTRQIGIVTALSCFFVILLNLKFYKKPKYEIVAASLLLPLITIVSYYLWLSLSDNVTITQIDYQKAFLSNVKELVPFTSVPLNERFNNLKELFHRGLDYLSQVVGLSLPLLAIVTLSNIRFFLKFTTKNFKVFVLVLSIIGALFILDIFLLRGRITLGFPIIIYESEKLFPIPWANIWKMLVSLGLILWSLYLTLAIKQLAIFKKEHLFLFFSLLGLFLLTTAAVFAHDQYVMPLLPIIILFLGLITKDLIINKSFALILLLFLILDSVQITKLVYDENGIAQEKAAELVQEGFLPGNILPGKNHPWHFWYDYESLEKEEIKKAGGNRKVAAVPTLVTDKDYQYIIIPERDLRYLNTELKNPIIEKIPFRSFLVKGELLFIKNNPQ